MRIQIIIIALLLVTSKTTAQKDTIYFDKNWKTASRETAVYYRISPLKIKTTDALGYKIKEVDSLFVIKDYYLNNNKIQFQGYSTDYEAKYLAGKAEWFNEDGEKSVVRDFNFKENKNAPRFKISELPIFYLDYKITVKSQFTGGLELCLYCENYNKIFFGIGFGFTNYNHIYYGLPDIHLSYNTQNLLFIKGGSSNKHAYALAGFTFFNAIDVGLGYSHPFTPDIQPEIKGFTFGAFFRFAGNSKNAYTKIKLMQ